MVITFDKNTANERSLEVSYVSEHIYTGRLSASRSIVVTPTSVFPDLTPFINNRTFATVEIVDDGSTIPVMGDYNYIEDLSGTYEDQEGIRLYLINISLMDKDE